MNTRCDSRDIVVTLSVLLFLVTSWVEGHGRLFDPPARSSAGRYGFDALVDPTFDLQHNCGGVPQYENSNLNKARCGVCGDPYSQPSPRNNEAGGLYASGIIVRNYTQGQHINVTLELTAYMHWGYSVFKICPNNDVRKVVTQECLDRYPLATPGGETKIIHVKGEYWMTVELVLPPGLVCTQCVLQWRWIVNTNNNCIPPDGECCGRVGCGLQENFYGCADVEIRPTSGFATFHSTRTPSPVAPASNNNQLPGGFLPLGGAASVTSRVTGSTVNTGRRCRASEEARRLYTEAYADSYCMTVCQKGSAYCPHTLCEDSCRN